MEYHETFLGKWSLCSKSPLFFHPHKIWIWNLHQRHSFTKMLIDGIITFIRRSMCILHTRCKKSTRCCISSSLSVRTFKLCQIYMQNKRLTQMMSWCWLLKLGTVYWSAIKYGPDYIFQVLTYKLMYMSSKGIKRNFLI